MLTSFGDGGRQPGQFYGVHSIAVDSQGNIYTTETWEGKRLQKFVNRGLGAGDRRRTRARSGRARHRRADAVPDVVLIHGNGGCTAADLWLPSVERALSAAGLDVVNRTFPDNVKARARVLAAVPARSWRRA